MGGFIWPLCHLKQLHGQGFLSVRSVPLISDFACTTLCEPRARLCRWPMVVKRSDTTKAYDQMIEEEQDFRRGHLR